MYKIVKSIIKILLFLICFNISAEQDLSGQSDIVEAESVDNLSTEDKTTSLSEDQVLAEELDTEVQLNFDDDASLPIDIMLVLDNSGSMKKNDPNFLATEAIKEFISQKMKILVSELLFLTGKPNFKYL